MLCCDMVLPDHFPSHCCWILHLSLVRVPQYLSLFDCHASTKPVHYQDSMQVTEILWVVYVYAVSIALTDSSFLVCDNVTTIRSL